MHRACSLKLNEVNEQLRTLDFVYHDCSAPFTRRVLPLETACTACANYARGRESRSINRTNAPGWHSRVDGGRKAEQDQHGGRMTRINLIQA